MTGKSYYVCSKCGATIEASEARAAGWLVATNVHKVGQMVIRCPQHITRYAERQTQLTKAEIDAIQDRGRDPRDAYYRP